MMMKKENWRILTNKEIYASVKIPTIAETVSLMFMGPCIIFIVE